MDTDTSKLVRTCETALAHGLDYLLERLGPDGTYAVVGRELAAYYKLPYVLWKLGHAQQARLSLEYILNEFLDADGSLRKGGQETANSIYITHTRNYMNTWLVRGAVALDCKDAAEQMLGYLKTQQHAETGGVYARPAAERTDIGTTSAFGVAALDAGDLESAIRAAKFLLLALNSQHTENDLYLCLEGKTLMREFPKEQEVFFVIRTQETNQAYWYIGIAMAFLARLGRQAADDTYIDAAQKFREIVANCAEDKFAKIASGKVGWGMKTLYQATQDKNLLGPVAQIAKNLCAIQLKDGQWTLPGFQDSSSQEAVAVTLDITVEIALWVTELKELLNSV